MNLIDLSGATLQRKIVVAAGNNQGSTLQNYITVVEEPTDISTVTRHPVDTGAVMSDHIILQPPELHTRLGWSNADVAAGGDAAYVSNIYAQILRLKNARQLMTVYTGKRFYTNMWPADIHGPRTDARTEWSIIIDIHWVQLLLVNLSNPSTGASPNSTTTNSNPNAQADPSTTQPTANNGTVQVQPQNQDQGTPIVQPSNDAGITLPSTITNSNDGGAGPVATA